MELKEAINCLENMISDYVISAYCDECHDNDNCTEDCYFRVAIDTVLEALEIAQAKEEVAFEQGYKKGKEKGTEEAFYKGLTMGLQRRMGAE